MDQVKDYEFEWDDAKAASNLQKHGVEFMDAMTVFSDPLMMTRFDDEHSEGEDRWVSLGRNETRLLLVVVHTFSETSPESALVRVISARPATRKEREQYEEG
jgi:uncharacterized protein